MVSHDTESHEEDYIKKLKENKENKTSENSAKPSSKNLKLNAEMASAMQTLTSKPVQEVDSKDKDF